MKIVYWPAGILKKVSLPVLEAPDPEFLTEMYATMRAYQGAGLSAVQVGVLKRIVTVDGASLGPKFFINPVIKEFRGPWELKREGCLSVPGFYEDIRRAQEIVVTYFDEKMVLHEDVAFHGFMAHVLQHEYEHLDGKLFLDHLTAARRQAIMSGMQALRRAGKLR